MAPALRIAFCAAALAPLVLADPSIPLGADDECAGLPADGDCALRALQLRAKQTASGVAPLLNMRHQHKVTDPEANVTQPLQDSMQELSKVQTTGAWCSGHAPPKLWVPKPTNKPETVKILTYNLFWWNLFKVRGGAGNSAGHLIKANMDTPFDVMGFQECEDPVRVLAGVGLLETFEAFQGSHAICMAYNKKKWALIAKGDSEVAEDMPTRYYGRRGSNWMRLKSLNSDATLFFLNHHGPLSVNSGGKCGGKATAYNLLEVFARHAAVGDILVLVGDFNANAASLTIQALWANLVQIYAGTSFGGVDNIFSNAPMSSVVDQKIMGSGGSDHDAIYATIRISPGRRVEATDEQGPGSPAPDTVAPAADNATAADEVKNGSANFLESAAVATPEPLQAARALTGAAKPGYDWSHFWCGRIDNDVAYSFNNDVGVTSLTGAKVGDPERCCRECQASNACQSWLWIPFDENIGAVNCLHSKALPIGQKQAQGLVSGIAYGAAAQLAAESARTAAISHM